MMWEKLVLTDDKAEKLKIDDFKEPTEQDYVWLYCMMEFGGVCSKEEISQIADIVYKAMKRKDNEK